MILNRAVCIDYPELDVPWFHTKYCEEFQSLGTYFDFGDTNQYTNYQILVYCDE